MRFTIAAAAALFLASVLPAQNPGGIPWEDPPDRRMTVKRPMTGEWMLGVDGGRSNLDGPGLRERTSRFAVFVERNIVPWLGVQVDVNCAKGVRLATFSNSASFLTLCTGAVSAAVPIPVSYSFWPYLRAGGGYAVWDEGAQEGIFDTDEVEPAFVAAVGARYFPFGNEKIALRAEISRTQTSLYDDAVGQVGFGVGLTLRIP